MKKPIHLYIFTVLSAIGVVFRLFSSFLTKFDEASMREMYTSLGVPNVDELLVFLRASAKFNSNVIHKMIGILLLVMLVATIVCLFQKKHDLASYSYLVYLFLTLVANTYDYLGGKDLVRLYSDEIMRQTASQTLFWTYIGYVFAFLLYFGVTVFFHLRSPKTKSSTTTTGTDI